MDNFTVITKEIAKEYFLDLNSLPVVDWVKALLMRDVTEDAVFRLKVISGCESPIEQALALAIYDIGIINFNILFGPDLELEEYNTQKEIAVDGKIYRADIYIQLRLYQQEDYKIVIECDGHDYHEKTKEQVKMNNKRERALKSAGYEVLRFSGSEIYENPYRCASEISQNIIGKYVRGQSNGK